MIDSKQDEAVKLEAVIARLRELLERATPGPWQLQDGCSWRRIGTAFHDGDVLCPDTYSREDRHPDLTARDGRLYDNLRLIVEGINALPTLLDAATLPPANLNAPDKQEVEGVEVPLLAFVLRCSADNPAAIGKARNGAIQLLERLGIDPREPGVFYHTEEAEEEAARAALPRTLPSNEALAGDDRNGVEDVSAFVKRLTVHAAGLEENGRYDPAAPSGLTNADAVSYGGLLREAAERLSRTPSSPQADVERVQEALGGYACLADFADTLALAAQALTAQGAETMGEIADRAVKVIAALSTMTTRPAGGEEVGWTSDMSAAPSSCMIFTAKWGVTEGLRFDDGTWGVAAFNGQRIAAEPLYWRHKPNAPGAAALTKPAALVEDEDSGPACIGLNGVIHDAFAEDEPAALPKACTCASFDLTRVHADDCPAALPKDKDLDQLVQDARVVACGTRLTCRERETIRALCDAVEAMGALPKEGEEDARLRIFLEILSAAGGETDASDARWNWINAFCEGHEGRSPDTYNRANDLGYVNTLHDPDASTSTAYLTPKGREYLSSLPVRSGEVAKVLADAPYSVGDAVEAHCMKLGGIWDPAEIADEFVPVVRAAVRNALLPLAALAPPPQAQVE